MTHPAQAALLLVDIVDSAALAQRLGDREMAALWTAHDRQARDLVRQWGGREIDKTDGFLLMFSHAADALGCALAYHRALSELDEPISARAGIHVGPVTLRENDSADVALGAKPLEVDGLAKPIAARVMATALGGQTLLTQTARLALDSHRDDARDAPVPSARLVSHGHWRLKGMAEPIELFEAGHDDAPFTPPPDADKAYRVVRHGGLWQPVREVRHSLPAERDAFVGRHASLLDLVRRFEQGARLVSVLGIGGTGKTRLVTRFGWTWLGDHPGGVWFCDLAPARSIEGVVSAVAQGLQIPLGKGDLVEQLGHAIAGRGACLLILDNFEQVAGFAEQTLGQWMDRAHEARFLVTSREVLGIAGEDALALAPLPATEGETLFSLRASAARHDACLGPGDRDAITTLVQLLDGLPLAIELAAARVRILPPKALLARMSERFKLLTSSGGRRDRQSTLRAAFDWSWDMLTSGDRAALAQLSVFEGGFTLEAAEAVIDLCDCSDAPWSVDAVHSLVDKSFVRVLGGNRFDLLVSVQVYAAEHLVTAGRYPGSGAAALADAQARHGSWFAALGPARATDDACADLDNLVAACRRAVAAGDTRAAGGALEGAWAALKLHGPFSVGAALAEAVSAMTGLSDQEMSRAAAVLGGACDAAGRLADAHRHFDHALALARDSGDRSTQAELLVNLAGLHVREGRFDEGEALHQQGLVLAREVGARLTECAALNGLGNVAGARGELLMARGHYLAALALARDCRDRRWEGAVLGNLGTQEANSGSMDDALDHFEQALKVAMEFGDRQREGNIQANLGLLWQTLGQADKAITAGEAALVAARELGHVRLECIVRCNLGIGHAGLGQLAPARTHYDAALVVARSLGDLRSQGQIQGYLGQAHALSGDLVLAGACLDDGEALLREVADQFSLALLLCHRAEVAVLADQREAAQAVLTEAKTMAQVAAAGAKSELGLALSRVAAMLELRDAAVTPG